MKNKIDRIAKEKVKTEQISKIYKIFDTSLHNSRTPNWGKNISTIKKNISLRYSHVILKFYSSNRIRKHVTN